uniref:Uncharacterized protein n=1 Tax=Neogobius melanostomus TaxID=47308 RepID=A0A8C6TJG0_9GOBI
MATTAEAAVEAADSGSSHSPLVSVSFQKNEQRKLKFLEGEPKALGITQICLSVFQVSCMVSFITNGLDRNELEVVFLITSVLILIAGSVAVACKNLHMPTLKACVGMEIVATASSLFNLILCLSQMEDYHCFHLAYENSTYDNMALCRKIDAAHVHLFAELVIIQVTLLSISVTLVVYACKVVSCCSPAPKVPVITIRANPAQQ